eukprot:c20987_g1_i2 orf=115-354(+)
MHLSSPTFSNLLLSAMAKPASLLPNHEILLLVIHLLNYHHDVVEPSWPYTDAEAMKFYIYYHTYPSLNGDEAILPLHDH